MAVELEIVMNRQTATATATRTRTRTATWTADRVPRSCSCSSSCTSSSDDWSDLPCEFRELTERDVFVDLVVVLDVNLDGDGDVNLAGAR